MNSWDPGWAHSLLTPTFSSLPSSGLDTLRGTSQHQQPSASGCQSVIWSSLFQSVSAQILCAVSNRPLGRDFPCSKTSIPLEKHHVHRCSGGVAVVGGAAGEPGRSQLQQKSSWRGTNPRSARTWGPRFQELLK